MKIAGCLFLLVGVVLCISAFLGHSGAWAPAALCFFASCMIWVTQKSNKNNKE